MRSLKILHTADLHLDSPFEYMSAAHAVIRRSEQRQLLDRLADLARINNVDIVLMSGDLFESAMTYAETEEQLARSLRAMAVPVFIAPGNHDYYSPTCRYRRMRLPANVHIFTENKIECVELEELNVCVYGAAFTDRVSPALLKDFHAPRKKGMYNVLCIHGEFGAPQSPYDPITENELACSGMDYAALGHIHSASGLRQAGGTWYSWPGCPEGRGFDETGEKYVNLVELSEDGCSLEQISIAKRCYRVLNVDVSAKEPLIAIHTSLPDDTVNDIYRIILTGECDTAPDVASLYSNLSELFFELQIRDLTKLRRDIWEKAGEDTLRGIFLKNLRAKYESAEDDAGRTLIEQAARWGLAALDNGEEVAVHEDK